MGGLLNTRLRLMWRVTWDNQTIFIFDECVEKISNFLSASEAPSHKEPLLHS